MRPRALRSASIPLALLTLAALTSLAAAGSPTADAWCPEMRVAPVEQAPARSPIGSRTATAEVSAPPLRIERADYRVDVLGNLALGTLVVEFVNSTDQEVRATYAGNEPAGLAVESLRVRIEDDEPRAIEASPAGEPKGKRTAAGVRSGARVRRAERGAASSGGDELVVPASGSLTLEARFRRELPFVDGGFTLDLPAVRGECAKASRVALPQGAPSPMGLTLTVLHPEPLVVADSPSHDVLVSFEGDRSLVELVTDDPAGDRPFRFDYALGLEDEPALAAFVSPERDGMRDVLVVLAPAVEAKSGSIRPKEALFVLDTSGSMSGAKIDAARKALASCLERLGSVDRFNVAEFDSSFTMFNEEPAEKYAVNDAYTWLDSQEAKGGTTLLPALAATFAQPHDPERHRMIVVLTDGILGDETKVQEFLQEQLGDGRLFVVGIGENAKQDTIRRLAEFGRGTAVFVKDAETLEAAVQALFAGISEPVAWDLELKLGDAQIVDMQPRRLPDLYAGRPVSLTARVRGELPADLTVKAHTMEGERTFSVALPSGGGAEFPQLERLAAPDRGSPNRGRPGAAKPRPGRKP